MRIEWKRNNFFRVAVFCEGALITTNKKLAGSQLSWRCAGALVLECGKKEVLEKYWSILTLRTALDDAERQLALRVENGDRAVVELEIIYF